MKLRHIEVFRAVMLSRSVTRAAVELRTSQPTASRFLGEMEREIGFKLFRRDGNRLVPTSEAVALYEEILRSFVGLERILAAAEGIANFHADRLRIASIPSMALGPLASAVPEFVRKYRGASVSLDVHAFDEVIARVAARQCEIGFTAYPVDHAGIRVEPLVQVDAVCVLPADHRLREREEIHARDLRDAPFVSLEGPSRQRIDKLFANEGVERRMIVETQTGALACCLVRQGAGIAVLDPFTADALADAGLAIRPFRPRLVFDFNAVLRAGEEPPRIVIEFLTVLRQTIAEMLRGHGSDRRRSSARSDGLGTAGITARRQPAARQSKQWSRRGKVKNNKEIA